MLELSLQDRKTKETESIMNKKWQNNKKRQKDRMTKNDRIIKRDRRTEEDRMTKWTKRTKETEWQKRQNKKNGRTEGDILCKHDFVMTENRM